MPVIALLRPLARAIDWLPVVVAAALALLLAVVVSPGADLEPGHGLLLLRMAGVLLGAAAAFALVDGMEASTGAVPVPRWVRQWARTLMAGAAVAVAWAATYTVVALRVPPGSPSLSGAAVEAALCVLAGLAGAAPAVRRNHARPAGLAGAAVLFVLYGATQMADAWPVPDTAEWDAVHAWWLAALPLPLLVLAAAHRDVR
ncbi:hypothetical protein [Nonomuraea sp. NPDC050786]|uniref:hypothetical protein n=1 Tax=Nonomuraea sp. NPDC050786 TaxID=3154840 RepID=UPI0033D04E32